MSKTTPNATSVTGVILAAGKGRRMGMPKSLLTWRGQTFIDHLIKAQTDAGITHIIVVTPEALDPGKDGPVHAATSRKGIPLSNAQESSAITSQEPDLASQISVRPEGQPTECVLEAIAAPPAAPMLHSLLATIEHLKQSHTTLPALLVGPVDQGPYETGLVEALLDGFDPTGDRVRIPCLQDRPGHPVLIGGGFVARLQGDHPDGLRGFFQQTPECIEHIPLPYEAIARNLNTRAQYDAFLAAHP